MPQDLEIFNSMPKFQYLKYLSPRNWLQNLQNFENILKNDSCNASKDFLRFLENIHFYLFLNVVLVPKPAFPTFEISNTWFRT